MVHRTFHTPNLPLRCHYDDKHLKNHINSITCDFFKDRINTSQDVAWIDYRSWLRQPTDGGRGRLVDSLSLNKRIRTLNLIIYHLYDL